MMRLRSAVARVALMLGIDLHLLFDPVHWWATRARRRERRRRG